jgi:putative membrane protein
MAVRWLFAALHLLALGIGLGAVWARGRGLQGELDEIGLRRVFYADIWWGIAALLWIATGLVRAFGGLEKGAALLPA